MASRFLLTAILASSFYFFGEFSHPVVAEKEDATVKNCAPPPPMSHGKFMIWGENLLIEYFCDEGFHTIGDTFGACIIDEGEWTVNPPICVAKGCIQPKAPAFGYIRMEHENMIARFSCGRGHYLEGNSTLYCDGKDWSSPFPICVGPGGSSLTKQRVMLRNNTNDKTVIGGTTMTIDYEAEVKKTDSTCFRYRYRAPRKIPNASVETKYVYNSYRRIWVIIANYTCNEGYHLESNNTRYLFCQSYKWVSPVEPKCLKDLVNPCETNSGNCSQVCVPGRELEFACDCYRGFRLTNDGRTCDDLNECMINNGGCEHICHNTFGSRFCLCREGYAAIGNVCFDLNECKDSRRNKCPGECINVPGSFYCNCSLPGYLPSSRDEFCKDFDECSQNNGGCHYKCTNTHGTYHCRCPEGFQLTEDNHNCTDIDECERYGSKICKNGKCINKEGKYQCICNQGYEQHSNGIHCTDVNECLIDNGGCEDVCKNMFGTHHCLCTQPGYQLDTNGTHCQDIDECELDNGGCEDICMNSMGSFQCYCNQTGYVLDGDKRHCTICQTHQYIDELNKECIDCPPQSSVLNYTASSVGDCHCNQGFNGNPGDNVICEDIDECITNILNCTEGCNNTAGSAVCTCPVGFVLEEDQRSCADVDECLDENGGCSVTCNNSIGSYTCECNSGFELDSDNKTCLDIDECWVNWNNCSHHCTNTIGSASCSCCRGYVLQEDEKSCEDKDECSLAGEFYCEDLCINTEGSFRCECTDPGYKLSWDGASCSDINECMEGVNNCEDDCINVPGSFTCGCNKLGYTLSEDGHTCVDVDECQFPEIHKCEHKCANMPGGYQCKCQPGYVNAGYFDCEACPVGYYYTEYSTVCLRCPHTSTTNGTAKVSIDSCFCKDGFYGNLSAGEYCRDINECEDDNFGCEQYCYNTKGSAHCGCWEGYSLHEDNKNCTDVDECIYQGHHCADKCINLPGTFKCGCRAGFKIRYDGRYCTDVDECYEDNPCEDYCENFWGSYACRCRQRGFSLAPDGHNCIATSAKLLCPRDVFVEVGEGVTLAKVTLPKMVTSGEYTISPDWVESGASFPVGVTTVTIATTNERGINDSCTFDVYVISICGKGTYKSQETVASVCLPCDIGTYQTELNQFSCKKCFPGTYQDQTGQSECKYCQAGTFQNLSSQATCNECPVGTYQDDTGQSRCKKCPIGRYQNNTGQNECLVCPMGTFQDTVEGEECQICNTGTFQDEFGRNYCKVCPPDLTLYPDNEQMHKQCPSLA